MTSSQLAGLRPRITRRNMLQAGPLGLMGLSMTDVWRMRRQADAGAALAKPKAVIYWLELVDRPQSAAELEALPFCRNLFTGRV